MTSLLHAYLIVSNSNLLYYVFASQMLHIRKKWTYQQIEFEILFKFFFEFLIKDLYLKRNSEKKSHSTNKVNCLFTCMWFPVTKTRSGNKRKKFRKFQGLHEIPDQFQELHVIPNQYRNYT